MSQTQYTPEEIARRGQALYDERIRPLVEPQNNGKFLVVDIDSGEYEIGPDDLIASDRAIGKNPDAVLYGVRIGFPTAYRLGLFRQERSRCS